MNSSQEALLAVSNLDGCMIQGRRMKVSISKSTQEKSTSRDDFIQTRASFLTHHTRQQVNEATLHRIFSRFGEVADCVVKQYEIFHYPRAKQCGYAYIYFHDLAAAKRAISSLSGDRREEIESIRMDCKLSLDSAQKLQEILSLDGKSAVAASGASESQNTHSIYPVCAASAPAQVPARYSVTGNTSLSANDMVEAGKDAEYACASRSSEVSSLSSPVSLIPSMATIVSYAPSAVHEPFPPQQQPQIAAYQQQQTPQQWFPASQMMSIHTAQQHMHSSSMSPASAPCMMLMPAQNGSGNMIPPQIMHMSMPAPMNVNASMPAPPLQMTIPSSSMHMMQQAPPSNLSQQSNHHHQSSFMLPPPVMNVQSMNVPTHMPALSHHHDLRAHQFQQQHMRHTQNLMQMHPQSMHQHAQAHHFPQHHSQQQQFYSVPMMSSTSMRQ
jgi:hypothetical protein